MFSRPCPASMIVVLALGACAPREMIARYGDGSGGAMPVRSTAAYGPVFDPHPSPTHRAIDSAYPGSAALPPPPAGMPMPQTLPLPGGVAISPFPQLLSPAGNMGSEGQNYLLAPASAAIIQTPANKSARKHRR